MKNFWLYFIKMIAIFYISRLSFVICDRGMELFGAGFYDAARLEMSSFCQQCFLVFTAAALFLTLHFALSHFFNPGGKAFKFTKVDTAIFLVTCFACVYFRELQYSSIKGDAKKWSEQYIGDHCLNQKSKLPCYKASKELDYCVNQSLLEHRAYHRNPEAYQDAFVRCIEQKAQ